MNTPVVKVPIVPQWNMVAGCVATPDQGFLYVGNKTINYISAIKDGEHAPVMKIFQTRQTIRGLDCDPNWSTTKYFAILAQDNSVQIWDFEQARAIYGHKAHFIKPQTEGDIPGPLNEGVHMSFMSNRNILSICSNDLVVYCVASNTFCRRFRIIPKKFAITILKCSPFNENIFAVGTPKGLVILADLKSETILYTLKGHDATVTSLSWNIAPSVALPPIGTPLRPPQQKQKPEPKTPIAASDDIFDIYDYDYLENEFGAPTNNKESLEQFEGIDKNQEDGNNSNFNYVEACESLKQEIVALENMQDYSSHDMEVNLADCQESKHRAEMSSSCDSNNSVELLDHTSDDESTNKSKHVMQHRAEVHTQDEFEITPPKSSASPPSPKNIPILASAGADAVVWIWNTKTGGACDQLKGKTVPHGKNYHIEALWLNSSTLLITSRSGNITSFTQDITRPGKYKEDKKEFPQQGVVSMCLSINAPLLWTISSHREILCENLETNKIVAKYSCASTNIVTMQERPDDMNKIAIAFSDRRIGVIDISKITPFNITIENFTSKIDSQVFSLAWGSTPGYLAFGTNEGRVGIFKCDNPKAAPYVYNPVCGKPIYSLDWKNNYLYVCCNEKVALYSDNMQNKDPIVLEYITAASSISVRDKYLFVGTQNGHVEIFKQKDSEKISYDLIRSLEICPRYVTEISWSPINTSRFAVASMSKKIRVYNFNEKDGTAALARDIVCNSASNTANSRVRWSNTRDNMLVASGFDGGMRVFDLNSHRDDEFFLKQFQCPMTCGMFLPSDENIIMCAGRTTSIEMFNMLLESTEKYSTVKWKKQTMKTLDGVLWATKVPTVNDNSSKTKKRRKRRDKESIPIYDSQDDIKNDEVSGLMTKLKLGVKQEKEVSSGVSKCKECNDSALLKNPQTILYLTTKEINKDSLEKLKYMLVSSPHGKQSLLGPKLFGTQFDAKRILEEEIRNQQTSDSKSISNILTHQVNSNFQQEVLKRIVSKTLTEWHVSLAPSVSYMFWKKCCQAFSNQLIEQGHILQAATYLMGLHDSKQVISILLEKQYFKEALIIAKIHCQPDDKIIPEITEKWVRYLDSVGNFNAAAYICAASGNLQKAYSVLSKTRNATPDIQEVLDKLQEKINKL